MAISIAKTLLFASHNDKAYITIYSSLIVCPSDINVSHQIDRAIKKYLCNMPRKTIKIKKGERPAQLVIERSIKPIIRVPIQTNTNKIKVRGKGGYGSTGF